MASESDDDEHTEMQGQDGVSDSPPAGYQGRHRRLSIVITMQQADEHGRMRATSLTVPLLGNPAANSNHCRAPVTPALPPSLTDPRCSCAPAENDKTADEKEEGGGGHAPIAEGEVSPGSSPTSSRGSSPSYSEDSGSDNEPEPEVDEDFAAGLEAMKAQYDLENGIDRSAQQPAEAGGPPLRFAARRGRRAAVSIDTTEPIRAYARDKVRQAIIVSLGPESETGKQMIEELKGVLTVQDLQGFTARNAHNLSELGQIQVEMQMSALGAWKKGFNALRGAMMFGKLKKGREFDEETGEEVELAPEQLSAMKAEAEQVKAEEDRVREEEWQKLKAGEREEEECERAEEARIDLEKKEREVAEEAVREAAREAGREAERVAAAEQAAVEAEQAAAEARQVAAEAEAARMLLETAERKRVEAERKRIEAEAEWIRLEQEAAEIQRLEEEHQIALENARQARLDAIRMSKNLSGSKPLRTPRSSRKNMEERNAALIPAAQFAAPNDATLTQVFAGTGIGNRAPARSVSSQSARVKGSLGGAARTFSRGSQRPRTGLGAVALPFPAIQSPRQGVKGSLPSVSMQRLGSNQHRVTASTQAIPTTA